MVMTGVQRERMWCPENGNQNDGRPTEAKRRALSDAQALGISRQTLYDILAGKQPVTPSTAVRLGAVLGTSAASWLNMQVAYDLWHAEREIDTSKLHPLKEAS
jgi:addiction module HigA family antidote